MQTIVRVTSILHFHPFRIWKKHIIYHILTWLAEVRTWKNLTGRNPEVKKISLVEVRAWKDRIGQNPEVRKIIFWAFYVFLSFLCLFELFMFLQTFWIFYTNAFYFIWPYIQSREQHEKAWFWSFHRICSFDLRQAITRI
jgi:hypothetical protein